MRAPALPSPYSRSRFGLPRLMCAAIASAISFAIVTDVDHVVAALASQLARADVHGRHAEVRALADRDARIADDGRRSAQQPQEILGKHVPEQVEVARILLLAEHADALRRAVRPRVDVRPEPQHRQAEVLHRVQRLVDLLPRLVVLRRDRMLHDDEITLRQIRRRTDAAVLLERIEIHLRTRRDLGGDVDRRTAGDVDGVRVLTQLSHAFGRQLVDTR